MRDILIPLVLFAIPFLFSSKKKGKKQIVELDEGYSGIVVDPEKVKEGKCKCIKGTRLCFMKGVIGALNEEQRKKLCKEIEEVIPSRDVVVMSLRELLKYAQALERKIEELEKVVNSDNLDIKEVK